VASLEHLAHAALAEPFEQKVLSQDELVGVSAEDLVDLMGREPAARQKFPGEGAGIGEATAQSRQFRRLSGFEQSVGEDGLDQVRDSRSGHGTSARSGCKSDLQSARLYSDASATATIRFSSPVLTAGGGRRTIVRGE
jgi:hypothetical protein